MLQLDHDMEELAQQLIDEQSLLVFGRGYNYATALEGALKVKEVSLMHSEGILAGEMKHGPLALVDENLPIVVIATRDGCFRLVFQVVQRIIINWIPPSPRLFSFHFLLLFLSFFFFHGVEVIKSVLYILTASNSQ